LAADHKGKVYFGKMDIDRNRRTATQFGIQSIPMVFAFKNGKPAGSLPGLRSINDYDMLIERLLNKQS
jgi:putative thioredoxin